jgi:hypothetical protein
MDKPGEVLESMGCVPNPIVGSFQLTQQSAMPSHPGFLNYFCWQGFNNSLYVWHVNLQYINTVVNALPAKIVLKGLDT